MKLQFLGHACFLLDDGVHKVLTDPFLTGNGLAAVPADQAEADFIFVTHGHSDHTGDAVAILITASCAPAKQPRIETC